MIAESSLNTNINSINRIHFSFEINDLTTKNNDVCLWEKTPNLKPFCENNISKNLLIDKNIISSGYKVKLKKNHTYEFKLFAVGPNPKLSLGVSYSNTKASYQDITEEAGGGRISIIENYDEQQQLTNKKKYHYNTLDKPEISSGSIFKNNQSILHNEYEIGGKIGITSTILSNTAYPTYGGLHIGYHTVIEETGTDFSNGLKIHKFNTSKGIDIIPVALLGNYIPSTPTNPFAGFGNKISETVYKIKKSYII